MTGPVASGEGAMPDPNDFDKPLWSRGTWWAMLGADLSATLTLTGFLVTGAHAPSEIVGAVGVWVTALFGAAMGYFIRRAAVASNVKIAHVAATVAADRVAGRVEDATAAAMESSALPPAN